MKGINMEKKLSDKDFKKFQKWVRDRAQSVAKNLTPIYKAVDNRYGWVNKNKSDKYITGQIRDCILHLLEKFENGDTFITTGGIMIKVEYANECGGWEGSIRFIHEEIFYGE